MTTNDPTKLTLAQLGADSPEKVATLFSELHSAFDRDAAQDIAAIDLGITRVKWLGRKSGIVSEITVNWLKPASKEVKPAVGQSLNALKSHIEERIAALAAAQEATAEQSAAARDKIDLSLPGIERAIGTRHLIRQTYDELLRIFSAIGYSVVAGPEIETPYYNFEALNIPEYHPARDNMDTFYMEPPPGALSASQTKIEPRLLRTHTSPMQIRTMEKQKPPVRIIMPGKVYRRDNPDATHAFAFHQIEGLAVDTDLTFCDFAGTIDFFIREFFGPGTKSRFRPSYFPFTEPSVEFDASCIFCGGSGMNSSGGNCSRCKGSGWIELFGAGMVDPAVYGYVKYDAAKLNGFAFGIGIDRLAMLKFGIDDLQVFTQNDVRFLRQFP